MFHGAFRDSSIKIWRWCFRLKIFFLLFVFKISFLLKKKNHHFLKSEKIHINLIKCIKIIGAYEKMEVSKLHQAKKKTKNWKKILEYILYTEN